MSYRHTLRLVLELVNTIVTGYRNPDIDEYVYETRLLEEQVERELGIDYVAMAWRIANKRWAER